MFLFLSGVICHPWRWEPCVRRSEDRGSTGSPLGGVPQQVSRLVLLDWFSEKFCGYILPCLFGFVCSCVCVVGVCIKKCFNALQSEVDASGWVLRGVSLSGERRFCCTYNRCFLILLWAVFPLVPDSSLGSWVEGGGILVS